MGALVIGVLKLSYHDEGGTTVQGQSSIQGPAVPEAWLQSGSTTCPHPHRGLVEDGAMQSQHHRPQSLDLSFATVALVPSLSSDEPHREQGSI